MYSTGLSIEAVLDDPSAPAKYRSSGDVPYQDAPSPMPSEIVSRQITLRDRVTAATLVPFSSHLQVPVSLLSYLCDQLNREIERGDTYPMTEAMPLERFAPYWFANFGAVMILGDLAKVQAMLSEDAADRDWNKDCLGSFYIKPNYPGRSSHVCNGAFLVTDASRNRGVGRMMGEGYIDWAPKLGYRYSVFNLVYETNIASTRIWDGLGFKRIGRVPGCGNLRSHPDRLVDAIIYGRELGCDTEEFVSEERFDKIRYYLKHNKYPAGADRAEKSRLRSAATHYRLVPCDEGEDDDAGGRGSAGPGAEKLMLKGKEVISDPQRQYEIAKTVHAACHGGINKMTKTIAQKYHWVRIKETVSLVISNCPGCKDYGKHGGEDGSASGGVNGTDDQTVTFGAETMQHGETVTTTHSSGPELGDVVTPASVSHDTLAQTRVRYSTYDPYNPYTAPSPTVDPQLMHNSTDHYNTYPSDHGIHHGPNTNNGIDTTMTNEMSMHNDDHDHQRDHRHDETTRYQVMDAERAAMAAREALRGFAGGGETEESTATEV